jgi:DGQHR domain-containing protein
MTTRNELRLPALEIKQGPNRTLFQFTVDGKQLDRFATVSRIHRDDDARVQGYQRPEALAHIAAIRKYIESENPMIPNGIVIAFDGRVRFVPDKRSSAVPYARTGTLVVPLDASLIHEDLPGWIVDGQQRTAAIRDANVECFPVPVTAFITDNEDEQREQFILVNSAKPLSKSLIYELLPGTATLLPPALARRRTSAQLLDVLNQDPDSPFFRRIQTPTNPDGVIKDNSVLRMLDNSITEGYLYLFRDPVNGAGDLDAMADLVNTFWTAVARVFGPDWNSTPRRSRLVHGVGIVSMGFLMDAMADRHHRGRGLTSATFMDELSSIKEHCHWSSGEWQLDPGLYRRWNELQNTTRDIQLLSNFLLGIYRGRRT